MTQWAIAMSESNLGILSVMILPLRVLYGSGLHCTGFNYLLLDSARLFISANPPGNAHRKEKAQK